MRFSVFLVGRSTAPEQDRFVMQSLIDHARQAEDRGFDAVFMPDHHFTGYAPMSSDPFVFAAYLAGQLKKIHFGMSVTTVPLHHPVRFAERVNLLDQLTEGRLLVGIGSGTTPEEMIGFGVNYKDASSLLQENLDLVQRLWEKNIEDDPIIFETGHYKGAVVQRIVPAPWQKPFTRYRDALLNAGHSDEVVNHCLSWTTHTWQCVHIAPTDEQAREEMLQIMGWYQQAIDREYEYNKRAEEFSGVTLHRHPDCFSEEWIKTWCLYGSPETVAEELERHQQLGIGNVLLGFTNGPLTEERLRLSQQSISLFADQILPRFR